MQPIASRVTANLWIVFSVGMIFVLALPSFGSAFLGDDYAIMALRDGLPVADGTWFDIYRFSSGDSERVGQRIAEGWLPWWTHESLKIAFLRPLPGVFLAIQHALFDENSLGYHIVSFVAFAVLVLSGVSDPVVLRRVASHSLELEFDDENGALGTRAESIYRSLWGPLARGHCGQATGCSDYGSQRAGRTCPHSARRFRREAVSRCIREWATGGDLLA